MSNTRRAKWSAEEIHAGNALDLLAETWNRVEAAAVREVITARLTGDLAARGLDPQLVEVLAGHLAALDDDFWLSLAYARGLLPGNSGV